MKPRKTILTGTALGLLMATAPLAAHAASLGAASPATSAKTAPGEVMLLAQADEEKPEDSQKSDDKAEPKQEKPAADDAESLGKKDAPSKAEKAPEKKAPEKKAPEKAPKPEPKAESTSSDAEPAAKKEKPAEAKQPPKEDAGKEAPKKAAEPSQEPAPAADGEPSTSGAKPGAEGGKAGNIKQAPKEKSQEPSSEEPAESSRKAEPSEETAKEPKQAPDEETGSRKSRSSDGSKSGSATKPEPAEPGENATPADEQDQPSQAEKAPAQSGEEPGASPKAQDEARPENAAPVLDSQKDQARDGDERGERAGRRGDDRDARGDRDRDRDARGDDRDRNARDGDRDRGDRRDRGERRDRNGERADQGPPPDSDRAAQRDLNIEDIRSATEEKGRRIKDGDRRDHRRHERGDVVKKLGDRVILNFGNRTIVENSGRERIRHGARDYYEEALRGDRVRQVVTRRNGVQVVTIRNRYGDIIRRSRIDRDGNETVLVYAGDERNWEHFHDPAEDLPPLRLTIPVSEYILRSDEVHDPERYYEFLDQPPVEEVDQLYTIDQVKYSSRVRDMVRRVDLDTINFATGSAEITQGELPTLDGLAQAIQRLIDENPGETFLIEGHTDAVGSDESNLVLSDRRAESVASALTQAYDIPPENLFTQGYGEQYLKIDTEGAARENRRVAIRRITPLVSPVASNQ